MSDRVLRPDVAILAAALPPIVLAAVLAAGASGAEKPARQDPADTRAVTIRTVAARTVTAGTVTAPTAPAGPRLADFDLRRGTGFAAPIRMLDRRLARSDVSAVLESSGQSRIAHGCARAAGVPSDSLVLCWDREDSTTRAWVPQGVSSVSDATADEEWGGTALLVSWYARRGIRVSFVNPSRGTYRHVLLVQPVIRGGLATYEDIGVHAGGIAWFGNRLYVADTRAGLREFDMSHIYDLARSRAGSAAGGQVGLYGGKYHARGYRYVMPQTGNWHYTSGLAPVDRCRGTGPLRTSWVSIDRTGGRRPVLAAGEYCGAKRPLGRVVTWPLREGWGLGGSGSLARASWAATLPDDKIQGGVRTNGYWWFSRNRDSGSRSRRGQLLLTYRTRAGWADVLHRAASYGPEDLSCFRGQNRIWTVSEHAGKRALWGTPAEPCA
ncbi:hypothetical protein [Actinomadura fibrosa]|uniref:Secreted protein n=1 Tax=Actinomadura fibrosa TaxID=111802 RepID=A0ABW2XB58_9ACTN|nr:hypothetical protein [Actinomadura fibrosa]